MLTINKEILAKLNPCKDRFDNYLNFYSNFEGNFSQFIDLENISYEDKIWVAKKLLNKNQLVSFAILTADSVVHIYENKYPNDSRVKDLINFLKTVENFEKISEEKLNKIKELREAANAAINAAYAAYATYATYAAANAAYAAYYAAYAAAVDAANAAANAAYYASYAAAYAAAYTAYATAYAAANAAKKQQQDLNLQFLKMAASL